MHESDNDKVMSADSQLQSSDAHASAGTDHIASPLPGAAEFHAKARSPGVQGASAEAASSQASPAAEPVVARLTGARMPADRGMSSLGLLMQLGGTIGMTLAAVMAIAVSLGGAGQASGILFLIASLSGVRSALHRMAGTQLLYGKESAPLRSVRTYLWASFAHGALCLLFLKSHLNGLALAKIAAVFLSWPVTLLVYFSLPHIKALIRNGVPDSEDHGFEGAAVLMTVFGIMGTLFAAFVLTVILDNPGAAFATFASSIFVLIFVVLAVRSVIHSLAGFKGISGANFDECNANASRYYSLGVTSAVCIGITLFVVMFMTTGQLGVALMLGVFSMFMLLSWPSILRRLYAERNFLVYLAGSDAPTFQRAPDAGLIALGWTLIAISVFGLGPSLFEALWGERLSAQDLEGIGSLARSSWWSVGTSALQFWAGIELVRMSERHKLAAMIYGVVSSVVTLYLVWPMIDTLDHVLMPMLGASGSIVSQSVLFGVAINLVLAIGTIVLVNRVTMPSAVVHIRKSKP